MQSFYIVAIPLAFLCTLGAAQNTNDLVCEYPMPNITQEWIAMNELCIQQVRSLLDHEMWVATQYLALAAYHYRTYVSRPGYGDVFLSSADHHRSNCKRLIDYLTMRGQNIDDINTLLQLGYDPAELEWENVIAAMKFALRLEGQVTDQFRNVIGVCEDQTFNDYNLNNWLTKEFLYTQYNDMKWYADSLSSLMKTFVTNGYYGEFLLDIGYQDLDC